MCGGEYGTGGLEGIIHGMVESVRRERERIKRETKAGKIRMIQG